MKFRTRLIAVFFVILISVPALAELKTVAFDSGVAFAPAEVILGSISAAGGGVILRDVAVCNSDSSICNFHSVRISNRQNTIAIQVNCGKKCFASYKTDYWVIKSAIDLVDSETNDVFRNINLLGQPTDNDLNLLDKNDLSQDDVWYVEVSSALAETKAGETLLTLDLLLTDLEQYGITLDYTPNTANKIIEKLGSEGVANWTWTDEKAHSSFSVNCTTRELKLDSKPGYTFLSREKTIIYFPEVFESSIRWMNPNLIDDSVEFTKVAAFFRHVRKNYPEDWAKLKSASRFLRKTPGETPRLLMR